MAFQTAVIQLKYQNQFYYRRDKQLRQSDPQTFRIVQDMRQSLKKETRYKLFKIILHLFCGFVFYNIILISCFIWDISAIEYTENAIDSFRAENNLKGYVPYNLNSVVETTGHEFVSYKNATVIRINSAGFRDRDFQVDEKPDLRIAALGDSMTFGPDVAQDKVFPKILEQLLQKSVCMKEQFPVIEVMNLGNTGTNLKAQMYWYNDVGRRFHPDLVIWQLLSNDHMDDQYFHQKYKLLEHKYFTFMPWTDFLVKKLQKLHWRFNPFFSFANKKFIDYNEQHVEELMHRNFLDPIIQSKTFFDEGTKVFLMIFSLPPLTEERLAKVAKQAGYEIMDFRPIVRLDDPDASMVLDPVLDHHLTEFGHKVVAEELFREIRIRLCPEK
jgi:hypothetical protein